MLKTTIAGSLPKPTWLAEPECLWAPWQLTGEALSEGQRDAALSWIKEQEAAHIDIVSDGEQFRQHFVHSILESIDSTDFNQLTRIGIRENRYEADVPTVTGPVKRSRPIHSWEAAFTRLHTTALIHLAGTDDHCRYCGG